MRCKRCVYVFDEDEWICERCGLPAPPGARLAQLELAGAEEPELEPADFDADELGLDPEEE